MLRSAVAAAVCAPLLACGAAADPPGSPPRQPSGKVVVLAASSLTEVFTVLADELEAADPGLDVVLSYGGSSGLLQQVLAGAPADVYASASPSIMTDAVRAGAVAGDPEIFAVNELRIVVPAGNPGAVDDLTDLADEDLAIALCAVQVPCGATAQELLGAAGVTAAPDTLEQDVKAVLAKVRMGEVDAGLVYRTDALAAGDAVETVVPAGAAEATTAYSAAVLTDAANPAGARAFLDLVTSPRGTAVLRDAGFNVPAADATPRP